MESKDCVWVLQQLWTPNSMFYTKVLLLDTLLNDSKSLTGFRWLFTDRNGEVKRHSEKNAGVEHIVKSFISTALTSGRFPSGTQTVLLTQKHAEKPGDQELLCATLISGNDYELLNRPRTVSLINQRGIMGGALQQYIYPYKDSSVRYQVTYKAVAGRFLYTFVRISKNKDKTTGAEKSVLEKLKGGDLCRKMQEAEKEIRIVLERNAGVRVLELSLLFILDKDSSLWLSGSTSCHISSPSVFYSTFQPQTPVKTGKIPSLLSQRMSTMTSFRESVYLPTQASQAHTFRMFPTHSNPHGHACAGDFCNFILAELKSLQRAELDYDDLIKVVRTAYSSDGQQEALNIKLAIAVDYLGKERSKLKAKNVSYLIPNRYVLLGRQLMKRSKWQDGIEGNEQLEIDLTPLVKLGGSLYLMEKEIIEIEQGGQIQPLFYYDNVKVCGRCYPIYLMIRKAHANALQAAASPVPESPKRVQTSQSRRRSTSIEGAYSLEKDTLITNLGRINKNNLNDLLLDMRFAQDEEGLESNRAKAELGKMYRNMTEGECRKKEEEKRKESTERANVIEPKRIEGHSLEEDLTLRFFPAENTKSLRVFDEKSRNLAKWRKFVEQRKHVRPKSSNAG